MNILNRFLSRETGSAPVISAKTVVMIIITAALFMFFGSKNTDKKKEVNDESEISTEYILPDTEKQLEEILSGIKGAGRVEVMIYYCNYGEKIIASDSRVKSGKEQRGDEVESLNEDREKSAVLYGGGGDERPFVTEERMPKPDGVLIIAEGAENEKVKYEIAEAVRALLGISPNRIRVSAKNKIS